MRTPREWAEDTIAGGSLGGLLLGLFFGVFASGLGVLGGVRER